MRPDRILQSILKRYKSEQEELDRDIANLGAYIKKLEVATANYTKNCEKADKRIEELEQQEKAAIAERKKLAQIVQEQNLTEVDIHRLTSERQELDAKLRTARAEKEEKLRKAYDLEVKQSQAFGVMERRVEEYEAKATKLGLIPKPPPQYEHIDFQQGLNGAAPNPAGMVPDCTSQIKPAIARLKADSVKDRHEVEEQVMGAEEDLAEINARISVKDAESYETETRLKNQLAELENAQNVSKSVKWPI